MTEDHFNVRKQSELCEDCGKTEVKRKGMSLQKQVILHK